jgi:integrase
MNKKSKSTLEKLEIKLRFQNYAETTIATYLSYAEMFLSHFKQDVYHISVKDARHFLENYTYTSISQQNQIISSVKFMYLNVVGSQLKTLNIKRPRKQKKLPRIIDAESLVIKIKAIENLKHRAILQLGLSCGLRISEVVNLKWDHLDRKRNILKVVNGKGRKDRSAILNDSMINLLINYWKEFKSEEYVFNGQSKPQYSTSSIQKLVKKYIDSKESFHVLRNSYATFAIDNGTELKPLSVSMGHNSTKTVERHYFHQSTRTLQTIKQAM